MSTRPLADEIRPQRLDEVVGQRHLIGPGGVLRRLIDAGTSANMIFYGPSGTGKTTIANIIANKTNKTLYRLNATTASLQDVKDIIAVSYTHLWICTPSPCARIPPTCAAARSTSSRSTSPAGLIPRRTSCSFRAMCPSTRSFRGCSAATRSSAS